jgi:RNA polymerase sigma-70 factor, ECF subfamily
VYFGGRSIEETAAALQLRPGTVKSRTHYAIAALRKKLGRGDLP